MITRVLLFIITIVYVPPLIAEMFVLLIIPLCIPCVITRFVAIVGVHLVL